MTVIDPATLSPEESYKLLIGVVVPRPIAWVTTVSPAGVVNLAPFSAFTFVSPNPPMIAISIGPKPGGLKDTARNIMATEEFVVNIATAASIDKVHASSFEYGADESELAALGLATLPSQRVRPPRLAISPVQLECSLRQVLEFGRARTRLMVAEIVLFHLDPAVHDGVKVDSARLDPLARLAGPHYARLGEVLTMPPAARRPG